MDLPALDLQSPNILGSYLQGYSAPYQMQGMQTQAAMQGLNLQQLQLALQFQRARMGFMGNIMGQLTGQGSPGMGRTGGIQNGPQDAVGGTAAPGPVTGGGNSATPLTGPTQASGSYNGSMGGAPSVGAGTPTFDTGQAGFSPEMRLALGALDPEMLKGINEAEQSNLKKAQLQAQPMLDAADAAITSANPERLVMNNPGTYGAAWQQFGKQLGLDTSDPRTMTPENVRAAAVLYRNSIAGQVGLPATPMPAEASLTRGQYGQLFSTVHGGTGTQGATSEVVGQKLPTYAMEKGYDINTGKNQLIPTVTSPGGAPAPIPGASGGGTRGLGPVGGVGSQAGAPVDMGYPQPKDTELKSASFAAVMGPAVQALQALENQGKGLGKSERAVMINVASDENPALLHQWYSQQVLGHMSSDDQQYITAAMPMIQAISHNQSGVRLNPAVIRSNMESAIPIDPSNPKLLAQVNEFRNNQYRGMLAASASAVHSPLYQSTLGADAQKMSQPQTKNVNGKNYVSLGGGRWAEQ